MSAEATGWVYRYSPFVGVTFWVHHAIADSVNDQHENLFWMGQCKLAKKARVSRRSAQRALALLLDAKFVELVEEGKDAGESNLYRFLFPDIPVVYNSREIANAARGVRRHDAPLDRKGASPHRTECATVTHLVRHGDAQTQIEPKKGGGGGDDAFGPTAQTPGGQEEIRELLHQSGYAAAIVEQVLGELSFRLVSGKPLTAPGSWCKARAKKLSQGSAPVPATKRPERPPEACIHGTLAGEPCERCRDEAARLRAGGWRAVVGPT